MIRRTISAVLLLGVMLLAASCAIGASALTQQQLQEFIRECNIQPLMVEYRSRIWSCAL